jgi:hypothetical protein
MPVAHAAARAAEESGTEVTAAPRPGPRAPWALLKRRRRGPLPEAVAEELSEEHPGGPDRATVA